jgi:hypothetical protein
VICWVALIATGEGVEVAICRSVKKIKGKLVGEKRALIP